MDRGLGFLVNQRLFRAEQLFSLYVLRQLYYKALFLALVLLDRLLTRPISSPQRADKLLAYKRPEWFSNLFLFFLVFASPIPPLPSKTAQAIPTHPSN